MAKGTKVSTPVKAKAAKPAKVAEKKVEEQKQELDKDEIEVESSEESESDVELSEESESEGEEEPAEIKGLEEAQRHVIIKPSKKIDTSKAKGKKGVIYLGRIPEGFEEAEMEKYFKQFGDISRLKLSRNKKTGKSKHYGFIEFNSFQVAKVAAEAMNNYLIFGHLLKCYVVENPSDLIFSSTKFRIIPWKSISKFRNDKPKTQKHWEKLDKKFDLTKESRKQKLSQKGIDLSYLD